MARVEAKAVFKAELVRTLCARAPSRFGAMCTWLGDGRMDMLGWEANPKDIDGLMKVWSTLTKTGTDVISRAALDDVGSVVVLNQGDVRLVGRSATSTRTFLRDIGARHGMAIAVEWDHRSIAVIYLLRDETEEPWSNGEARGLREVGAHAVECLCISDLTERVVLESRPCRVEGCARGKTQLTAVDGALGAGMAEQLVPASLPETAMRHGPLTARETEVALHYASGWSHKELARRLGMAPNTARVHIKKAFAKLGVCSKTGLRLALATSLRQEVG